MINASEIRIGNYYQDRGGKTIKTDFVETVEEGRIVKFGQRMFIEDMEVHPMTEYSEYANPIELTLEWLLKFGFTEGNQCYKEGYSINIRNTDFYLRPSYLGGFYWGFNISDKQMDCELNDVKPLKYVHELQDLYFAITRTELKTK